VLMAYLDLRQYRLQRGRYSVDSIERQRGRLASLSAFDISALAPGDIVTFHTRTSTMSWLVMYLTSSVWSHAAMYVGDGEIVDVTTSGGVQHPLSDYLDGESFLVAARPPYPHGGARAVEAMRSTVGAPYGWAMAIEIGRQALLGARREYDARHGVDILLVLGLLTLPAIAIRGWVLVTGVAATGYVAVVVRNRLEWRRLRALPQGDRRRERSVLARYTRRWRRRLHGENVARPPDSP